MPWTDTALYVQQQGSYPGRAAEYAQAVCWKLEIRCKVAAVDYLRALEIQTQFIQHLYLVLAEADVDAMVFPSTAIEAPRFDQETIRIGTHEYPARAFLLRHKRPATPAGVPALS